MKKPKLWKIGVYLTCRSFGGSEEGGWYYTEGDRIKEIKKSFFNIDTARKWANRLNNYIQKNGVIHKFESDNYVPNSTTGELEINGKKPDSCFHQNNVQVRIYFKGTPDYFPKHQPIYC